MSASGSFTGFPREALDFLAGLGRDNTKRYFDAHRAIYESALLAPAKDFVVTLGDELRVRVSAGIRAEPRVNGSILRINRDLRFSRDKRPYKEHLDMMFWEGDRPSRESPGLFIRLRADRIGLAAGMHRFERPALEAYRAAVIDERTGRALEEAVARATELPEVTLAGPAYKRVPRGHEPEHARAALLLYGGLFVGGEWEVPAVISEPGFVTWVAERLERMAPLERWLSQTLYA